MPSLLPALLLARLLGWWGTLLPPSTLVACRPITVGKIRLGATRATILALGLILATTMFGALLVLQVGASLIQLIAGRAAPGALLTDATRRSLGRPALDRPG